MTWGLLVRRDRISENLWRNSKLMLPEYNREYVNREYASGVQRKSMEKLIQLRKLVDDDCTTELSPRKDQVDSSNNTHVEVELKKKQSGQTKTVIVKHTGVEEDNLGKLSSLCLSSIGVSGLTSPVKVVMSSSVVKSINEPKHPPPLYTYQRKETLKDSEETGEKLTLKGEITN